MDAKIQAWRSFLERQSEALAIWGSGSKCVAFLRTLNTTKGVDAIIDINPHRKNRFAPASSQPINTPDRLIDVKPAKVILMNAIYEREIAADLAQMGLDPDILTLEELPQ
jgi:hypothetical protein